MTKEQPVNFIVTSDNVRGFTYVHNVIQNFISNEVDVPYSAVKELLRLLYVKEKHENWLLSEEMLPKAKNVARMLRDKGYHFSWKDRKDENGEAVAMVTERVFYEMLYAFRLFEKDQKQPVEKDDAIAFYYQCFDDEYKNLLVEQDLEEFNEYRQHLISGLLTIQSGFAIVAGTTYTFHDVYDKSRNAVNKYKKDL